MNPLNFYDSGNVYFPMLSSTLSGGSRRLSEDRAIQDQPATACASLNKVGDCPERNYEIPGRYRSSLNKTQISTQGVCAPLFFKRLRASRRSRFSASWCCILSIYLESCLNCRSDGNVKLEYQRRSRDFFSEIQLGFELGAVKLVWQLHYEVCAPSSAGPITTCHCFCLNR